MRKDRVSRTYETKNGFFDSSHPYVGFRIQTSGKYRNRIRGYLKSPFHPDHWDSLVLVGEDFTR